MMTQTLTIVIRREKKNSNVVFPCRGCVWGGVGEGSEEHGEGLEEGGKVIRRQGVYLAGRREGKGRGGGYRKIKKRRKEGE